MPDYIYEPRNIEIEDEDFVLRVAIENLHFFEDVVNPELFLLRNLRNGEEKAISVVVEKLLKNQSNPKAEALSIVPAPPGDPERSMFRINVGDLRQLLIGVSHSPSDRIPQHGSLHGCFTLGKANEIVKVSNEVKEVEKVKK